jgi:probable rRNA maturation factor
MGLQTGVECDTLYLRAYRLRKVGLRKMGNPRSPAPRRPSKGLMPRLLVNRIVPWQATVPRHITLLREAIGTTIDHVNGNRRVTISIALGDDAFIQALNKEYRGKDKPTNVLSFQYESGWGDVPCIGELVFSRETIVAEAKEQDKEVRHHFIHLAVHGTLHILGYDHEQEDEAEAMEELENEVLQKLAWL